jgi:hypothetical protein
MMGDDPWTDPLLHESSIPVDGLDVLLRRMEEVAIEREIVIKDGTAIRRYAIFRDGALRKLFPSPIMDGAEAAAVAEVARLQDENRRLREEGIRDTLHILFNECEWGVQTSRSIALFFPPGFSLPTEQTISRTAMADALTDALLPLVP